MQNLCGLGICVYIIKHCYSLLPPDKHKRKDKTYLQLLFYVNIDVYIKHVNLPTFRELTLIF